MNAQMKTPRSHHADYWLVGIAMVLLILGILILASVSSVFAQKKAGKTTYFLFHQIIFGVIPGIVIGLIASKASLNFLKKWSWLIILINLFFMILVFVPKIGIVAGGASRWVDLGPISFQPSEFLKLSFVLYLSAWLASRTGGILVKKNGKDWKFTLLPFLSIVGVIALLLYFQSDLTTLAIIIFAAFLMYFSAKTPFWHSILTFFVIVSGIAGLIIFQQYRFQRLLVFLNIAKDPLGLGYQINQALIAVGSGGIFGLGPGMSNQKFGFIPQAMTDSIFAIFSEEMGFIGSFILIGLFLFLLWRGFRISKNSQDKFSQIFAIGIVSWISLQAFINIGANIQVLPLAGIPLPFVSYGGSHIITELIGIGLLLNISKNRWK